MENTIFNWIIGIIVTILLGAVGSGFWEIMLKPVLRYISFKSMSLTAFFFKKWRNYTYKSIGSGVKQFNNASIVFCVFACTVMLMLFAISFQLSQDIYNKTYKEYNDYILKISPEDVYYEYINDVNKFTSFEDFIKNKIMNYNYYRDSVLQTLSLIKNDSEKYKKISNTQKRKY